MSTATGERRRHLNSSREHLLQLPLNEYHELPGRPTVVYQIRSYTSPNETAEQAAKQAREDAPFLFRAFETGQVGPKKLAKLHGGTAPRMATIHEYLDWTVTAQQADEDDELDFGGFRVVVILPRYVCTWPPPNDDQLPCSTIVEGERKGGIGGPKNPLPFLQSHGKPLTAATIRAGPDYLEVPFVATHESKRGRGYCRCVLEAIEDIARACAVKRLMLCSTNDATVQATWRHLGFVETSDAEMASWDIHHSDLVHLANTTQMQKLVPEPRRYKSVIIKQGAFKQRCYATMGACGPLSTFPIRPHRTQSMRSLGNTIFSSSQGTGAGVSGAASGALSGGATVNTMASGGHTVNTAATASSADDTNMLDVEVKVGDEVDDRAAAGMVSRAASGSGAAPVGAGGAAGASGAAAPAAAPSTPHPEHQPRSMLLDKDADDAAQPKPKVPTAVAATASAAVVAPACLHGVGQGTDAAGPSEAPCVASAAAARGVDASTTATSAWHATDTSTDQHDAKGTAGPGPQAKSNDLHAPIPFGGVLHPPPGAVHSQPPALQEQQSVRGAASCNPAVASTGAATPTAPHAGVPMEHAAQPLSDQGDGSGNAGILGVQPQAQAPCGQSTSPGQHVDDGDDGSDAVMQETREGPEQSQGSTEPATDTSRHSPPPAALEPPDSSHAGMQGDDLEQGQGQHTASPSQQPAVTAGGTGQKAAAHVGSADAKGNGLHQKPEAAAIAPAAGSAAANGNACMDAAITGGQDEVKAQCTDEPGCGSQQQLPATASGPAPGQQPCTARCCS